VAKKNDSKISSYILPFLAFVVAQHSHFFIRSGNIHPTMSYSQSFSTDLIHPIIENECNEYVMITKINLEHVSD
jgi:hypothetical protein